MSAYLYSFDPFEFNSLKLTLSEHENVIDIGSLPFTNKEYDLCLGLGDIDSHWLFHYSLIATGCKYL
jgi:hypothetical protein